MGRLVTMWERGIFTLFVDNLPTNVSNVWLKKIFMKEGAVVDTYVSRKRRRGCEGAFGFVRFKKEEEAIEAIKRNNNLMIDGKKIMVQLSKFARVQGPNEGEKRFFRGDEASKQALYRPVQGRSTQSYVDVVKNSFRSQSVGVEKGKNGDGHDLSKDLICSERDLLEGWVKLLVKRNIIEEKAIVVVGDKKMMIHGVIVNSSLDSGMKSKSMGPSSNNKNRAVVEVSINPLERGTFDKGNKEVFVDPMIVDLVDEGENQVINDWGGTNRDDYLFPEIFNISRNPERDVRNFGLDCEGQGESSPVCLDLGPILNTEVVHEYTGPWAPGYFKGPIFENKRKQTLLKVAANSNDGGKDGVSQGDKEPMEKTAIETSRYSSSGHINLALETGPLTREDNLQCEGIEVSSGSDLSLPPGFASSIPVDVVKVAKVKKKLEVKLRSGRSSHKTSKEVSIRSERKNSKKPTSNPITPEGVLDFALLLGLNIDGKEDETKLKIAKILQDEWEHFQKEKKRMESKDA